MKKQITIYFSEDDFHLWEFVEKLKKNNRSTFNQALMKILEERKNQ